MDASIDEVWSLGTDIATAVGQVHVTGKDQGGAAIERARRSTGTYVREGGKWKIQMITTLPKQ
jgi:ketosteroid isomerase-like protein